MHLYKELYRGPEWRFVDSALYPLVVDRSKPVTLVQLLFVWLYVLYYQSSLARTNDYAVLLGNVTTSLGEKRERERERVVYMLLIHLYVYRTHVTFCLFTFLLWSRVGCGLWLWHSLDISFNVLRVTILEQIKTFRWSKPERVYTIL